MQKKKTSSISLAVALHGGITVGVAPQDDVIIFRSKIDTEYTTSEKISIRP